MRATDAPMTWMGLVLRNLFRRPGRAAFTLLGVALAVASYMALLVYERLGIAYVRARVSLLLSSIAGFCAFVFSHNLGFALLTGGSPLPTELATAFGRLLKGARATDARAVVRRCFDRGDLRGPTVDLVLEVVSGATLSHVLYTPPPEAVEPGRTTPGDERFLKRLVASLLVED